MFDLLFRSKQELLGTPYHRLKQDRVLAAIDVGTNSIHMAVVRVQPDIPAFTIIAREKNTVRLGDREPRTGRLTVEAMERATSALRRCQEIAKALNAEEIIAPIQI